MVGALSEFVEILLEEGKAFETQLGRMTICWAETEYSIYRVLLHYSRVSEPIGRSIFSGMQRAKPMMDAIDAILENTNAPQARRDHWAFVSAHIGSIQTLRDLLTHHMASTWTTKRSAAGAVQNFLGWPFHQMITNAARVRQMDKSKTVKVDSTLIGHMCHDMRVIGEQLERHTEKGRFKRLPLPAWLYKFPQPIPQKSRTRPKSRRRSHPQRSSRGK